jgi:N-acetyl-gamma-glutamyl-phosphate reductase
VASKNNRVCSFRTNKNIYAIGDVVRGAMLAHKASKNELALKQVVNTNRCLVHLHKHEGKLLITSIIDNLLKGASGQAVENMNLMFGFEQTTGLNLKSTAF